MMRDDALAPVVAMMLILAVVVTLFSLELGLSPGPQAAGGGRASLAG
ncbi:MAG: hypothetical protein A4E42_01758 [Methanoregulaceae archaeon PtaU1.Bin222]|nr:MAG: hypothetical protein A4E42_01758 [Methanoregulaceae archaeon PtaU1.Bin222]